MARNISFFHTQDQIRDRSKTVTRRKGWLFLEVGDVLNACEKCQGLGKGGKIVKICRIKVVSLKREPLDQITYKDTYLEGFPDLTPENFISFFSESMKVDRYEIVTRIEFEYI